MFNITYSNILGRSCQGCFVLVRDKDYPWNTWNWPV